MRISSGFGRSVSLPVKGRIYVCTDRSVRRGFDISCVEFDCGVSSCMSIGFLDLDFGGVPICVHIYFLLLHSWSHIIKTLCAKILVQFSVVTALTIIVLYTPYKQRRTL